MSINQIKLLTLKRKCKWWFHILCRPAINWRLSRAWPRLRSKTAVIGSSNPSWPSPMIKRKNGRMDNEQIYSLDCKTSGQQILNSLNLQIKSIFKALAQQCRHWFTISSQWRTNPTFQQKCFWLNSHTPSICWPHSDSLTRLLLSVDLREQFANFCCQDRF